MDGVVTGRPGLGIGEHGEIWVKPNGRGAFTARTRVRDLDGRVRDVTATDASRGAAHRALQRKLESRTPPTASGVTASMTIETLGEYWLQHRVRTGLVRTAGPVKPQTLAAYRDALVYTVYEAPQV